MGRAETEPGSDTDGLPDPGSLEPHAEFEGLRLPPPAGLIGILNRLPVEITGPWTRFANALLTCGTIPPALRELAILRTASRCGSDYIVGPHRLIGRHLGLTEEEVALALEPPKQSAFETLSPSEVVLAATDQLLERGNVDDWVGRLLDLVLGRDGITELAMVIGQYVTVGYMCKTAGLDPEPGVGD